MLSEEAAASRDPRRRDHLRRQAVLLDTADIGTIDAWCGRVVREHFAHATFAGAAPVAAGEPGTSAGIDPAFSVLDEKEAALLHNEVAEELFRWIYTAESNALAAAARAWIARSVRPNDSFLRT